MKLSIFTLQRKAKKVMASIVFIFLAVIFLLTGILVVLSPGIPEPLLDDQHKPLANSLAEKIFVEINGNRQGMIIKSRNLDNPVLLYLHGGMPDYFLTQKYPSGLEDYFTVVWWEQRGAGMSYDGSIAKESITVEQLIADTVTVTNYLRERFKRDKIYLMGHSGGTYFGIQTAARYPQLYTAYIAVAQIANTLQSEKLAYDYMLAEYRARDERGMVRRLEAAPVTLENGIPRQYLTLRDSAMHSLGIGTTHDMKSILTGIFLPSLTFREYSLTDKFNLWRAKARNGVSILWETSLHSDLSQGVTHLDLPVYFFEGIYDYTCSAVLAQEYFKKIESPIKGLYIFRNSAHSPIFEEPARVHLILKEDVLAGKNGLADEK